MEDYQFLKKEHEEDGKTGAPETSDEEGRALLCRMKHISKLIADVCYTLFFSNLLIYYLIGCNHFLEIRIHFLAWIPLCILLCPLFHSRTCHSYLPIHHHCIHDWRSHINLGRIHRYEDSSLH